MRSLVVLFAFAAVACASYIPVAQPPHHPAIVLDPHGRPLDTAEVINARALHLQAKALDDHDDHIVHAAIAPVAHSVVAPIEYEHGYIAAPAAVSHQSRIDVHSSPAIVSHSIAAPVLAHSAYAPLLGLDHSFAGHEHLLNGHEHLLTGHEHLLKKRSLAHISYIAPSAVSHQSRVDIIEKPAVVSHHIATPVIAHAVETPVLTLAHSAVAAPISAHSIWGTSFWGSHALSHAHLLKKRSLGEFLAPVSVVLPSAVSHQSRLDIIEKPAVVSHSIATPLIAHAIESPVVAWDHSAIAAPVSTHSVWGNSFWGSHAHGHLLKKRSLGEILAPVSIALPSAVSHQSRVDIIEEPTVISHAVSAPVIAHAAPVAVAHIAPAAVSHQSRVDVLSSDAHFAPLAHSAVWSSPASHWSHSHGGLFDASHW